MNALPPSMVLWLPLANEALSYIAQMTMASGLHEMFLRLIAVEAHRRVAARFGDAPADQFCQFTVDGIFRIAALIIVVAALLHSDAVEEIVTVFRGNGIIHGLESIAHLYPSLHEEVGTFLIPGREPRGADDFNGVVVLHAPEVSLMARAFLGMWAGRTGTTCRL